MPTDLTPRPPTPSPQARRRQWWVSGIVVAVITAMQVVPPVLDGHDTKRALIHLAHCLIELPILMVILSATFTRGMRRALSGARLLLQCVGWAALIGVASSFAVLGLAHLVPGMLLDPRPHPAQLVAFGSTIGVLHGGIWALAFLVPYMTERARAAKAETEELRSTAELARLRSQLEPHFLLNTLNTIAGLVTDDAREARRLIVCLGDLLRDSLRAADEPVRLEEEIAWLRRYAEILESRHPGVLAFDWDIADETRNFVLPRLLLQPLVENAVKHGALARREGGCVAVRTAISGAPAAPHLICTIEDNGPGVSASPPRQGAFGLQSVRRRLELRCRGASLKLESSADGTRAILDLPAGGS